MPTLNIQGQRVKVDDSFLKLSPADQQKTVEEIASQLGIGQQQPESPQTMQGLGKLSEMTRNPSTAEYSRQQFENLPTWQKPLVAAGDTANIMADSVTFGMGDRLAAGLRAPFTDKSYAEELAAMRGNTQQSRDRAGSAGVAASIIGSSAVPIAAANRGATLAGRLGTGAMTGAKGVGARAGLLAVEGAGYGAADAAGHGQDIGTGATLGAIGGGVGSMASDAIGAGLNKLQNTFSRGRKTPDLSALKNAEKAAYDASEKAGVIIKPNGLQGLKSDVTTKLSDFGYDPALQPRIAPVLQRLDDLSQQNVTLKGLHTLRKVAGNAAISNDPSERKAAGMVIESIDNFMENLKPQDVLMGDKAKGVSSLRQAIELGKRVRKNERFLESVGKAELRAASTGSGGNTENAVRQNVRSILEKGKGWTPDEKAALEEIVRGTPGQNLLRLVGKLSPQGNGLMAALGVGGAMVNPTFGAASLTGMGAKMLADRGVMQGVQAVDELIRAGGNANALRSTQQTLAQLTQPQRDAVARLVWSAVNTSGRQAPGQQ